MKVMNKSSFNDQVAAIRALSVLLVLGYHFFPSYFPLGYLGVDGFFVISGFLIIPLIKRSETTISFIVNRIKRLYPALLVFVFIYMVVGYLFLLDDEYRVLLESSISSLLHFQNIAENARDGYFVANDNFRPFLNVWSLSVEFQVYVIYIILFFGLLRLKKENYEVYGLVFLFVISILSYSYIKYSLKEDAFFHSNLRLWEFIAGSLAYYFLYSHKNNSKVLIYFKKYKLQYYLMAFLGALIFVNPGAVDLYNFYIVFICLLFILFFDINTFPEFVKRCYVYVGTISYSVYLLHFPAVEIAKQFVGVPSIFERMLLIAAIFTVAHLVDRVLVTKVVRYNNIGIKLIVTSIITVILSLLAISYLDDLSRPVVVKNAVISAEKSFEMSYDFECDFEYFNRDYGDERCRIGTGVNLENKAKFLIFGDSLANSITTMFEALSSENKIYSQYLQFGKGSCPVVFKSSEPQCMLFRDDLIRFLNTDDIKSIFIANQWPLYLDNLDGIALEQRKVELLDFIVGLTSTGKRVVLIHTVPLGARPRTCVARFPWEELGACDIPLSTYKERGAFAYEFVEEVARLAEVETFRPSVYFCSDVKCHVFKNNEIFYLDDSHLSEAGGVFLANKSRRWWDENFDLSN
jgi:peptidoglycan/LPS O-acetylase OafA/YrhL